MPFIRSPLDFNIATLENPKGKTIYQTNTAWTAHQTIYQTNNGLVVHQMMGNGLACDGGGCEKWLLPQQLCMANTEFTTQVALKF